MAEYEETFYGHCTAINTSCREVKTYKHYENTPIQIYWKFYQKNEKFQIKNSDIFFIILLKP